MTWGSTCGKNIISHVGQTRSDFPGRCCKPLLYTDGWWTADNWRWSLPDCSWSWLAAPDGLASWAGSFWNLSCKMILDCFMGIFIWSYNIRYDYIIISNWFHPRFLVGSCCSIFSVFCVVFCFCPLAFFSFVHCIVCPSSIYGFWLHLHLQTVFIFFYFYFF
jgi:hypothetical protein